jgi:hypothetical protein
MNGGILELDESVRFSVKMDLIMDSSFESLSTPLNASKTALLFVCVI